MANIDEGTVLGGRYEITGRVMASAQSDQVLTGLDQVLNREVLILVAARANASQAATSARQLATGERSSSIQILDLGLSDDRTYLVAPGNANVEDLLALLTTEDVYVEPFFTELLGTELFGQSREHTPQTFDDDDEYYADLQDDLAEEPNAQQRPEFLNKLSDRIDDWLQEDEARTRVVPGQPAAAVPPTPANPGQPTPADRTADDQQPTEVVQPVTEPIAQQPVQDDVAPAAAQPTPPRPKTPLIPPPIPQDPADDEYSAGDGYAIEYTDEKQRSTAGRWIAGILLVGILVAAVFFGFRYFGDAEGEPTPPVADDPTTQEPDAGDEPTQEPTEEAPTGPPPVPASVSRVVPDSPELSSDFDADLPTIIDGNQATAWNTFTFTTPQFGGFASNMALVVELEEPSLVSEITLTQNQGSGGAFTVSVSDSPDLGSGTVLTEGSFTGPEYTVDAHNENGDPVEASYVIIDFTELPTLSNTTSPDRPYGLRIAEIEIN